MKKTIFGWRPQNIPQFLWNYSDPNSKFQDFSFDLGLKIEQF